MVLLFSCYESGFYYSSLQFYVNEYCLLQTFHLLYNLLYSYRYLRCVFICLYQLISQYYSFLPVLVTLMSLLGILFRRDIIKNEGGIFVANIIDGQLFVLTSWISSLVDLNAFEFTLISLSIPSRWLIFLTLVVIPFDLLPDIISNQNLGV